MLKKALRRFQKHLSPSGYMTAYWPIKKRNFVLDFKFIKRHLEGNMDRRVFLSDLDSFKADLISRDGLAPFEFELLKILISIKDYERIVNSLNGEPRKKARELMNPDSFYRHWAIEYFTEKRISQASPLIRQMLFEADNHIVSTSIRALGILEGQNSVSVLRLMAYHPDFKVHADASIWLGKYGNQYHDVIAVVQSLRRHISISVLEALSSLYKKRVPGTERAIPVLEAYLKDPGFYEYYGDRFMGGIIPVARNTLYLISGRAQHHPLYSQHSTDTRFIDEKRKVVSRRELIKTPGDPKTILLGGNQIGKAIIKIVPEASYLAWKKAFTSENFW